MPACFRFLLSLCSLVRWEFLFLFQTVFSCSLATVGPLGVLGGCATADALAFTTVGSRVCDFCVLRSRTQNRFSNLRSLPFAAPAMALPISLK